MSQFIAAKHSYNAGDLLTILPGLRQVFRDTDKRIKLYQRINFPSYYYDNSVIVTMDKDGNSVCLNEDMFWRLKPLIESQEYIESFEMWEGQPIEMDYDTTRDSKLIPMPSGLIHSWSESVFPQTATDLSEAWIKVETGSITGKEKYADKIIVNRTQRYYNPYISYYFLKDHQDKIIFSGTELEHSEFCKQWGLDIPLLKTDNFYQLAQIISWCKFGVYNQSLHFHIADAQKSKRILELTPSFPNTFVTGKNGYQFYKQTSFEYYFNKLLNEV